jgi:hypothetical protein
MHVLPSDADEPASLAAIVDRFDAKVSYVNSYASCRLAVRIVELG